MEGISRKIQQLGECKRSCVICLITLCLCGVMLILLRNEEEKYNFEDDYIKVNTTVVYSV